MSVKLLKIKELTQRTGLAASTIYLLISRGEFPRQIKLSKRTVRWTESDIDQWIEQRIELSRQPGKGEKQ